MKTLAVTLSYLALKMKVGWFNSEMFSYRDVNFIFSKTGFDAENAITQFFA